MLTGDDLPSDLPPLVRQRVIQTDAGLAFVLAPAEQTKTGLPILLTQRDVRETQLAKGAVNAGMIMLLRRMEVELADIDRLYLAGAFGNYIRRESARRIGLLPDIPLEKIQFIGNAAAAGAREVLLSRSARCHAETLARDIQYVELAGQPEFQTIFGDSMFFPEK
jgi:uncharacterized 2Fe-2S/4Fe-4S cluster protein (DUF4445 family)